MAIIDHENISDAELERYPDRLKAVGAKVSAQELSRLEEMAERRKQTPSAFIRELILEKIQKEDEPEKADPLLAEIVGVRLLLVNLLGPLACGQEPLPKPHLQSIMEQIKKAKHQVALDIQRGTK